ncbi:MAG: hypothetical protein A4E34_00902 [Methanoregula sp. PtaU1.Bin006]|nr:MAG: hypothetical protein A4E33_01639 [Methanoregula sp. PtaB.Bin085]OPY35225.1 MAG: hypothetical protein A4E34_00902 [Methanoregula sp. PtaU1.Bin006]
MDAGTFLLIASSGIVVVAISHFLDRIWASAVPFHAVYLFIRAPGVILHECAHILGCFLTGARIRNIVLFSQDGGSVTYSRPAIPFLGDVIISTAPLFVIPLALSVMTWFFAEYAGCVFPVFPVTLTSQATFMDLGGAISTLFFDNLVSRFNGWFLIYLYLTVSLVLSVAPSTQDMKNAAEGSLLLILAGIIVVWSGIPWAEAAAEELVRLLGYGFMMGLVFGLIAFIVSLPPAAWHLVRRGW